MLSVEVDSARFLSKFLSFIIFFPGLEGRTEEKQGPLRLKGNV